MAMTAIVLQCKILLLGTVQWNWAGVWMHAGWKAWLVAKESWMIEWLLGCSGTDCITMSITLSAYPIIAPKDMTECDFIVINVVRSLCMCLYVVTSSDPMCKLRNLDRYTIL